MKNNKIIYKNNIQKKYLSLTYRKRFVKKFSTILKDVITDLENNKSTLHSLSKKFEFTFQIKDLSKFRIFKINYGYRTWFGKSFCFN